MIFKKIFLGTLATAAVTLLASCGGSDLSESNRSRGEIQLASLQLDSKVTRSGLAAADGESEVTLVDGEAMRPELDSCKLIIMSKTGTYLQTWQHVSDYKPSENYFTVGTYEVTLSYGALEDEGFDKPYYNGSATTAVKQDETSEVSVEATLCNTMVKMKYTEAFKKYFTDYTATIHSEGGKYITFEKDETRAAYVRPGNISIDLSVTKPNGLSGTFEVEGISNAAARTLYNVTVDVNEGAVGDAQVTITYDEETIVEPITIKVSDEILAAPAPTITPSGFTPGTALSVFEGNTPAEAAKMQVMARSGLKEVRLTTQSTSLLAQGFPAEIELMSATAEQQAALAALGFAPSGLWKNPGEFALIDFTNLISHIKAASDGNNTSTFTLQVKDKYSKVCEEPTTMTVTLTPLELSLVSCDKQQLGAGYVDLTVKYNGEDFANKVSFKCTKTVNGLNALVAAEMSNIKDNGDGTYSLRITLPNKYDTNTVQMCYKGQAVSGAHFEVLLAGTLTLSCEDADVWAKKATVKVSDDAGEKGAIKVSELSFYIAKDGSGSTTLLSSSDSSIDEANSTISISNLQPGTKYNVYAQSTANGPSSNTLSFTTEAAADVPNGNFETTTQKINWTNIWQGGEYTNTNSGVLYWKNPFHNYEQFYVYEPTGWATTNAKTCCESAKNKNTWFTSPSVFNTPNNSTYTVTNSKSSSDYKTYSMSYGDAHGGSTAMLLRSVGWDLNGSTPSTDNRFTGNDNYPDKKPTVANKAAAKLFLGSYSFSANTSNQTSSTETYNQGVSFTSRPSKLHFYAKYTHNGSDTSDGEYGVAKVEVLDSDGNVIGSGEAKVGQGANIDSWAQQTAAITYSVKNKKAAKLRIFFSSSNNYGTIAEENEKVKVTQTTGFTQKSVGAYFYVDDVTLEY